MRSGMVKSMIGMTAIGDYQYKSSISLGRGDMQGKAVEC